MLGFVSFIPLLGGLVIPPSVVGPACDNPLRLSHREHGNADVDPVRRIPRRSLYRTKASLKSDAPRYSPGTIDHLQAAAIASLKSDASSASAVVALLMNATRASLKSEAAKARAMQRQVRAERRARTTRRADDNCCLLRQLKFIRRNVSRMSVRWPCNWSAQHRG